MQFFLFWRHTAYFIHYLLQAVFFIFFESLVTNLFRVIRSNAICIARSMCTDIFKHHARIGVLEERIEYRCSGMNALILMESMS